MFTNRHFVPGTVVGFRRPWEYQVFVFGSFLFLCGLFLPFFFVTGASSSCYQFGCLFSFFTSSSKFDNFIIFHCWARIIYVVEFPVQVYDLNT